MDATVCMALPYDIRSFNATTFALPLRCCGTHYDAMRSARDILAMLEDRGITRAQIASVLGISATNATKLYNDAKNGKPRKLAYDEGVALIEAFGLDDDADAPPSVSVDRLVLAISAALQNPPPGGWTADDAQSIAEVSARVAALDPGDPANPTTPRDIEMVVRGAIGLRRGDGRPA